MGAWELIGANEMETRSTLQTLPSVCRVYRRVKQLTLWGALICKQKAKIWAFPEKNKNKTKTKAQSSRVNTLQLEIKTFQVWVKSSTGNATHRLLMNLAPWNTLKMSGFPGNANQIKDALQILFSSCKVDLRMCCNDISDPAEVCTQASEMSTTLHFGRTARDHRLCWL